jgi:hypothetical protein
MARPSPLRVRSLRDLSGDILRTTDAAGKFRYHCRAFRVGKAFAHCQVALRSTEVDGLFHVFFFNQRLIQIDLR